MMAEQWTRPVRRFSNPRANRRKKGERDPYLFVITGQLAVCALVVALGYASAKWQPPFFIELSEGYQTLLVAREVALPTEEFLEKISFGYEDIRAAAEQAATDLIRSTIAPPEVDDGLDGAGGWMGVGDDAQLRAAPSSCALSPVLISAGVSPPVSGKITSTFGYRLHPVNEAEDFHRGLDIAAAAGSGIYTPLPGRVSEVDNSAIYGNFITIDHGNGLLTTYSHCEAIVAEPGAVLRKGELLALVGSTGISTGPHVHFEIRKDGKYYNPAWVLDGMNGYGF